MKVSEKIRKHNSHLKNQNTLNETSSFNGVNLKRKERRQLQRKLVKARRDAHRRKTNLPTLKALSEVKHNHLSESTSKDVTMKKSKKKKRKKKSKSNETPAQKIHRQNLIEDNEKEDLEIKKLEKKLGIKQTRKSYQKGFVDDGLDYLLDFCDYDIRKEIVKGEGSNNTNEWLISNEEEGEQEKQEQEQRRERVEKANVLNNNEVENKSTKETRVKFNDEIEMKTLDRDEENQSESDMMVNEETDDSDNPDDDDDDDDDDDENELVNETNSETEAVQEDIYGRTIDSKGNVVKQQAGIYIPPSLRQDVTSITSSVEYERLKRRLKGQLNRLSEKNLQSILNEIETLYRTNSRANMNTCLCSLINDSLISQQSLTPENMIAEHALLMSILHTNIGLEIGSYFIEYFLIKFDQLINDKQTATIDNKQIDNILLFILYLYSFYMTNTKLIYDIARKLLNNDKNLNEKHLELVLLLLKTVGFLLRKDDPLSLKLYLQELRSKCTSNTDINVQLSSKRVEFMMDIIQGLKNNDVRKIPGYDPERIERLRRLYRQIIKEKTSTLTNQLNVSYIDFLQAQTNGRWWIVGSSWQKREDIRKKNDVTTEKVTSMSHDGDEFNEKVLMLAQKQHMNTDVRKTIFCTLLTSEDCDDAVQKLHKMNLSKFQEREIIYVSVHCCLQEKSYNPYYSLIIQKFCDFHRRFRIAIQYHSWDKFKELTEMNEHQLDNFSLLISDLIQTQSLYLTVFKNFNFIELTRSARTFLVKIFYNLFLKIDDSTLKEIFQRVASTEKLSFMKDAFRLFLSHFVLKNNRPVDEQENNPTIRRRCQTAIDILTSSNNI